MLSAGLSTTTDFLRRKLILRRLSSLLVAGFADVDLVVFLLAVGFLVVGLLALVLSLSLALMRVTRLVVELLLRAALAAGLLVRFFATGVSPT